MKAEEHNKIRARKCGFTLIELMFAVVLTSILFMSIGGMIVGYWKITTDFINEQSTMQEISFLSSLFSDNTKAVITSITPDVGTVDFSLSGKKTSIEYNDATKSILYFSDVDAGNSSELLTESVVDNYFSIITNGNSVRIEVKLVEMELDKTNTYRMYATPRNY